jgi:hypothetical protein
MAGGPIIGLMKSVGESSSNQINIKLLFTKKILLTPMIAPSTQSEEKAPPRVEGIVSKVIIYLEHF